jgi:hypothetical protein
MEIFFHATEEAHSIISAFPDIRQDLNLPAPDFTDNIAVIFDRYARCCFARDTVYLNFLCLPRCFFLPLPMAIFFSRD